MASAGFQVFDAGERITFSGDFSEDKNQKIALLAHHFFASDRRITNGETVTIDQAGYHGIKDVPLDAEILHPFVIKSLMDPIPLDEVEGAVRERAEKAYDAFDDKDRYHGLIWKLGGSPMDTGDDNWGGSHAKENPYRLAWAEMMIDGVDAKNLFLHASRATGEDAHEIARTVYAEFSTDETHVGLYRYLEREGKLLNFFEMTLLRALPEASFTAQTIWDQIFPHGGEHTITIHNEGRADSPAFPERPIPRPTRPAPRPHSPPPAPPSTGARTDLWKSLKEKIRNLTPKTPDEEAEFNRLIGEIGNREAAIKMLVAQ